MNLAFDIFIKHMCFYFEKFYNFDLKFGFLYI